MQLVIGNRFLPGIEKNTNFESYNALRGINNISLNSGARPHERQ